MYTMAKWLGNVCYTSDGLGNSFSLMVFFNSIPSINPPHCRQDISKRDFIF